MRKQPERTERTRQALMDSFWALYRTRKIEKITVQEVVDGAGVYRSTFYEYFSDVYDVLETIENRLLEDFKASGAQIGTFSSMEDMVEYMLRFYEANGEQIAHLLSPSGDPVFSAKAMGVIKENFLGRMHLPLQDIKAELLFDLIASSIITLLNYWYAHREQHSLREVFEAGWPILKGGLFPCVTTQAEQNPKNKA